MCRLTCVWIKALESMSFMSRGSKVFHMGCNGEIRKKEPGNGDSSLYKWKPDGL